MTEDVYDVNDPLRDRLDSLSDLEEALMNKIEDFIESYEDRDDSYLALSVAMVATLTEDDISRVVYLLPRR